jgi:hypothetical protein
VFLVAGLGSTPQACAFDVDAYVVASGVLSSESDGVFSFAASEFEDYGTVVAEELVPPSFPFKALLFELFERDLEEVRKCQIFSEAG